MPGLLLGEFKAELRVYNPEINRVAFVTVKGHNFGECLRKTAERYPGWVVTDAAASVFAGTEDEHKWCEDGSTCVNCGVVEHLAFDDACSGVYGLL